MQVRKKLVGCPMVPFKTPIKFKTTLNNTKCRQLLFLWHSGHHLLHPKCHANFNWLSQLPAWRTDTGKMWPFPKWKLIPTSRTPTPNGGDGFYWPSVWRLLAGLGFFSNSNRLKWNFPHKPKVEVAHFSGGVTKWQRKYDLWKGFLGLRGILKSFVFWGAENGILNGFLKVVLPRRT